MLTLDSRTRDKAHRRSHRTIKGNPSEPHQTPYLGPRASEEKAVRLKPEQQDRVQLKTMRYCF